MYWWIELGYPDKFSEGADGYPLSGEVVKYYREKKKNEEGRAMSQQELADRLKVNRRTVIRIEKNEKMSEERRKFLSGLLGIPPALLGLMPMSEIHQKLKEKWGTSPSSSNTGNAAFVDIEEHKEFLAQVRDLQRFSSAAGVLSIVETRTGTLYQSLAQSSSSMHVQIHRMLWEYHIFMAQTWQRRGEWDNAVCQLDKAMLFANSLRDDELCAVCLVRGGIIHHLAGRTQASLNAFGKASVYEKTVPAYINGVRLLWSGPAYAKAAQTDADQKKAMSVIELGGTLVRSTPESHYAHGFDFSVPRYHLKRSEALLSMGQPRTALSELGWVQSKPVSWWRAHQYILEAQAYANSGNGPMAVSYAEAGLDLVKTFNSDDFHQIRSIHDQIRRGPYGSHRDTKRLGHLLQTK